jgi:UDP-2,3-diacylglucosamine pyrophosphatase LpxH
MKTLFVSDLHLDSYTCLTDNEEILCAAFAVFACRYLTPADVLCIAGDLADYEGLEVAFLKFVSTMYREVYFVHGNHDLVVKRQYPGRRFATSEERKAYVLERVSGCRNVHVLDGEVSGDGLVGGTMGMCDLSYRPEDQMEFDACGFWASTWFDGRTWNYCNQVLPDIMRREFGNLERICMAKPKIVMTHFCPMQMGVADEYKSDPKTAMFYFEAKKYLDMLDDGTIWVCGHTHGQHDVTHVNSNGKRIRIVCNPLGGPDEKNAFALCRDAGVYLVDV